MKQLLTAISAFLLAFFTSPAKAQSLASLQGKWRGVFTLSTGLKIPFNFEITANNKGGANAWLINAEERFNTGTVSIIGDTLYIPLDQFDNELAFKTDQGRLEGVFRRQDKSGLSIPVSAEKNITYRFKPTGFSAARDFSGRYAVDFKNEKGVGIFTQKGNHLRAVFLKTTGDSRYLEGLVEGNDFYLSSFIGSNPYYYAGTITLDGQISGHFVSPYGSDDFSGAANPHAVLPDAYGVTNLKDGYSTFDFSFPNVNGNLVSPGDARYAGKVIVVTIGGTWCPNCMDEAAFLQPWYKKNKQRGVEIISIQYERQSDASSLKRVLTRFREKYGIEYEILGPGIVANPKLVSASLPSLKELVGFPTTVFIDKHGKVDKIHTGFSGPATGRYYDDFIKEFNAEIDRLLKK